MGWGGVSSGVEIFLPTQLSCERMRIIFSILQLAGFPCISVDTAVCGGRPVITGTRMRVKDVLDLLTSGAAEAEILVDYSYVGVADIRACLAYAASAAGNLKKNILPHS